MREIKSRGALSGTALISVGNFATRAISIFSAPILTRLLTPEAYGISSLALSLVSFGVMVSLSGRELSYLSRDKYTCADERTGLEAFLWRGVLGTALVFSIILGAVWLVITPDKSWGNLWLSVFISCSIVLSALSTMAAVRVRLASQYGKIAVAAFVSAILGILVSILWALTLSRDAWAIAAGGLATVSCSVAILGFPDVRVFSRPSHLSSRIKRDAIKLGLSSLVTSAIFWAIMTLDRWALSLFESPAAVGVYVFAAQFGLLGMMLNTAISAAWLTESKKIFDTKSEFALQSIAGISEVYLAFLIVFWVAVCAAGADILKLLSAPPFHAGGVLIPIIASGVLFYGIKWVFVAGLFIQGRMHFLPFVYALGGAVAFVLYTVLAASFGSVGVAIGQCAAFATIAIGTWIASRRVIAVPINYLRLMAGFATAAFFAAVLSRPWFDEPLASLIAKIPAGLVGAILVLVLVAPHVKEMLQSTLKLR